VLEVARTRRIGHCFAILEDGSGRFHEEKRRIGLGISAHLLGVVRVIQGDAKNAADREGLSRRRGERDDRRRCDGIINHGIKPRLDFVSGTGERQRRRRNFRTGAMVQPT